MTKHKPFDQNLQPLTFFATKACQEVLLQLGNYEKYHVVRKRRRKTVDQAIFEQSVYCIVSNLILSRMDNPEGGVRITRSHTKSGKSDRYRTAVLGKTFPYVVDLMANNSMWFITQDKAESSLEFDRKQSVIFPTERIDDSIAEWDLTNADFGQGEYPEIIILKGFAEGGNKKAHYWDKKGYLQYEDTAQTNRMRLELQQLNNWLIQMDIGFESDYTTNIHNRRLRRVFTRGSFDSGGRLFGGFWLDIPKKVRNEGLRLNGEAICTLDYSNLSALVLYGIAGKTLPDGDNYKIAQFIRHREGVKTIFNCMTFTDGPLSRFPRNTKKLFERSDRIGDVTKAILKYHQPYSQPAQHTDWPSDSEG